MPTVILALFLALAGEGMQSQAQAPNSPTVEEHIRAVINELPPDSPLRRNLLQGGRGDGVHYSWMDDMRKLNIKRAVVWIDISFDRRGRPKKTTLNRIEYFAQYDGGTAISNIEQTNAIRASGLDKQLSAPALDRAAHGAWTDVPRPRPHPFAGGMQVQFLDDEWLPSLSGGLYYAR